LLHHIYFDNINGYKCVPKPAHIPIVLLNQLMVVTLYR
jgi:hypothetical protein